MAKYQILYWHDIPVQVKAKDRSGRSSRPLSDRFMVAVDKAAMEAGLTGSDSYAGRFHWSDPEEREGPAEIVAAAVAAELEATYESIDWRRTAENLKKSPAQDA